MKKKMFYPEEHINLETGQIAFYERNDPFKHSSCVPLVDVTKEELAQRIQDLVAELFLTRRFGPELGKGSKR